MDSELGSDEEDDEVDANVAMGLVATEASEAEPDTNSEDENEICLRLKEDHMSWYLDNGCLGHMTGEMSMFLTLTMKEGGIVGFRGNQNGKIIGT